MNNVFSVPLAAATALISACSTTSHGEYTTSWSEGEKTQTIKLSNGFSLRYSSR